MANLVEFGRIFLSYGMVLLVIVVLSAIALFLGITLAKRKNAKKAAMEAETTEENA